MPRKKMDVFELNLEVNGYLSDVYHLEGQHRPAIQMILSQYIDLLARSSRKLQEENIAGLKNHLMELTYE